MPRYKLRQYTIFIGFLLLLSLLLARLLYLELFRAHIFRRLASSQHNILIQLEPRRGAILDRNGYPLAISKEVDSVYAVPPDVKDKEKTAALLEPILKLDRRIILARLNRAKHFVWLKRKVDSAVAEKVKSLKLTGIDMRREYKRFYPNDELAAHIVGFAGLDNVGLEGLELVHNKVLSGKVGWCYSMRDAKQREIPSCRKKYTLPVNGYDLVLTLDQTIQHIAEARLDEVYKKTHAAGATIIIMEPVTGKILAMATRPAFNLNQFQGVSKDIMRNRAITDVYEPGSVFKIVTASCALDRGAVDFNKIFYCENGAYKIGKRILHDHRPHGKLTFREVIEKSSNIGTVKVAQMLDKNVFYQYIRTFGFGSPTKIDLPGEVNGMIEPPPKWSGISITSIPIGQEVAVTAIQLTCAISAIANDGVRMRPYILSEIRDEKGEVIKEFKPEAAGTVISKETAGKMKELLAGVVSNGTGRLAQSKEFAMAGKTGTAQKVNAGGGYSHENFVATFIGFAPADEPKIAIVISVDNPHGAYFGGVVAAPIFRDVATDTLRYLNAETIALR